MRFFDRIFRVNRTSEEVVELLNSILDRTISDADWDYFGAYIQFYRRQLCSGFVPLIDKQYPK